VKALEETLDVRDLLARPPGHDLSLANLGNFLAAVPDVLEVSIGHALISEALYAGLDATVRAYLEILATTSRRAVTS